MSNPPSPVAKPPVHLAEAGSPNSGTGRGPALGAEPELKIEGLRVNYGGISAVKGISLHVNKGEIVTLIGSNGAGKTSTLKSIVQLVPIAAGSVKVFGRDIKGVPTHKIANSGVALVPEGRAIFAPLTVRENLQMGAFRVKDAAEEARRIERCVTLFPRLRERMDQIAGTLSGGEQQMLAIGRGLMQGPKLLLLDEPSLGLAPIVVQMIFRAIQEIANSGITILLVEQNTKLALETAHRGYVLVTGEVKLSGTSAELRADERIQRMYLGEDV